MAHLLEEEPFRMTSQALQSVLSRHADARSRTDLRSQTQDKPPTGRGLSVPRRLTDAETDVFQSVEWERREAKISAPSGDIVFEQRDVLIPTTWSQMATNVVVSKYFRGTLGTPDRETSAQQMIQRISGTIAKWGRDGDIFASEEDAKSFEDELSFILLHQMASFNSSTGTPAEL